MGLVPAGLPHTLGHACTFYAPTSPPPIFARHNTQKIRGRARGGKRAKKTRVPKDVALFLPSLKLRHSKRRVVLWGPVMAANCFSLDRLKRSPGAWAAKRGGFKRGGFPIWTCPSFFVLFGTFLIFPGFSRFVWGLFGDFPDLSFSSFSAY